MAGVSKLWCPLPKTTQTRSKVKTLEDNYTMYVPMILCILQDDMIWEVRIYLTYRLTLSITSPHNTHRIIRGKQEFHNMVGELTAEYIFFPLSFILLYQHIEPVFYKYWSLHASFNVIWSNLRNTLILWNYRIITENSVKCITEKMSDPFPCIEYLQICWISCSVFNVPFQEDVFKK